MPSKQGQPELTERELQDLREVFDLMDVDKGGSLSVDEVKQLMELLGMRSRTDDVEQMIQEIDTDGSGQIDFEEFVQVMAKSQDLPYTKGDLLRAFRMFAGKDADMRQGQITPDTLEKVLLKYCGDVASEEEIMRLVAQLELTGEGYFDYAQKVALFLNK